MIKNNNIINNEDFDFLKKLYDFGIRWRTSADKIINSRQLCHLYFRNKVPLEDGTIITKEEKISDNLTNEPKFNQLNLEEEELQNIKNIKKEKKSINSEDEIENFDEKNIKENTFLEKKRFNKNIFDWDENDNNINNNDNLGKKFKKFKKSKDEKLKTELKNINIENNTNEYTYTQSENVKKYYLNQPLQLFECENLLSLINNKDPIPNYNPKSYFTRSHSEQKKLEKLPHININITNNNINNNQFLNNENEHPENKVTQEQINKFISMDYYNRYMYLRSNLIFHDDTGEQYCICRKGDDSVNYMIMCEKCKEWFHGKCLDMPKNVADNISHYYCLCCSRKYDLPKEEYHKKFYDNKRASINDLMTMIEEGKNAKCLFKEIEILEDIKIRSDFWQKNYYNLLDEIVEFYKNDKNGILTEDLENKLGILYLESEAIQIELDIFFKPINILRYNEWFKDVNKVTNLSRQDENEVEKLLKKAYSLFKLEKDKHDVSQNEKKYYELIIQRAEMQIDILTQLYKILHNSDYIDDISGKKKLINK